LAAEDEESDCVVPGQDEEAYLKVGKRDKAWDEDALKALDMAARRFANTSEKPSAAELAPVAKSVIDAGCAIHSSNTHTLRR